MQQQHQQQNFNFKCIFIENHFNEITAFSLHIKCSNDGKYSNFTSYLRWLHFMCRVSWMKFLNLLVTTQTGAIRQKLHMIQTISIACSFYFLFNSLIKFDWLCEQEYQLKFLGIFCKLFGADHEFFFFVHLPFTKWNNTLKNHHNCDTIFNNVRHIYAK